MTRGAWERRAHGCAMGTHGQRAWKRYVAMGWERIGAGGKQHGNNGAVLASAWGMGRGRHLPAPSPALSTNYTNSTATAPAAEAKGPGGRGARGEPRGAWCRSLRRRGEAIRGRERELEKQHSPKLTEPRIAFIDLFCTRRSDTDRNRRDGPQPQQRAHFFRPPTHPVFSGIGRGLERGASSMATTGQCWPRHGAWGAGDTCPLPPPLFLLITPTQQPRRHQRRLKAPSTHGKRSSGVSDGSSERQRMRSKHECKTDR